MVQEKECCGEDGENAGPRKYVYDRKYKEVERKLDEAMGDAAWGLTCDAGIVTVGKCLTTGGSSIACAALCARGPWADTGASSGCISSRPSGW